MIAIIGLKHAGDEYNMILANLRMTVQSERREEFLRLVKGTFNYSNSDPGCIGCRFYHDLDHEDTFALVEKWNTQEHLDSHIRLVIFRMLLRVMDILSGPPEIYFHEVAHTTGLETISAAFDNGRDEKKKPEYC
jgi:quinol monooxygenase YgiN